VTLIRLSSSIFLMALSAPHPSQRQYVLWLKLPPLRALISPFLAPLYPTKKRQARINPQ